MAYLDTVCVRRLAQHHRRACFSAWPQSGRTQTLVSLAADFMEFSGKACVFLAPSMGVHGRKDWYRQMFFDMGAPSPHLEDIQNYRWGLGWEPGFVVIDDFFINKAASEDLLKRVDVSNTLGVIDKYPVIAGCLRYGQNDPMGWLTSAGWAYDRLEAPHDQLMSSMLGKDQYDALYNGIV